MAAADRLTKYSSKSNVNDDVSCVRYDDNDEDDAWVKHEDKSVRKDYTFSYPDLSEDFFGGGYDSGGDDDLAQRGNLTPEVNLKNVLTGLFAIVTGQNKSGGSGVKELAAPDVTFLESKQNGDTYLHSSVYIPSAPPLFEPGAVDYGAYKEVLEAEPPEWVRDSCAKNCMQCDAPFTAITRGRHHCRFCGGIFCRICSKGRCLLPVKFRERNPQRVCDTCYDRLDPLQGVLINSISNATQVAKHDVLDWTSARGWLNLPVGLTMEQEIYKAAITLKNFCQVSWLNPERSIPSAVLKGAKGLAILTVAKAGALVTYKLGTGLVVVRRSDGSWSAPSAICSVGLGWGAQIGVELTDFIIVLRDIEAVRTFCSRMHFSLGAGCSAAAGPVGRLVEADVRAGDRGSGMCYTYSCSKGAFVGVSLEGNIVATRMDTNLCFYGDPYITTHDILLGNVDAPRAGEPLYVALDELHAKITY